MSQNNLGFVSSRETFNLKELQTSPNGGEKSFENPQSKFQGEVHSIEFPNRRKNSKDLEPPYEPYDNRMVQHPTSTLDTLFHLLKGSLGTGILAMPRAFSHSGWTVGTIATILIGLFCTYTIHILIKSSYELCKRRKVPSLSYPATIKSAFQEGPLFFQPYATLSAHVANGFLLLYQLGTCCAYTIFISENLRSAIKYFIDVEWPITYYTLMILIPLILINWIRNLKLLAPVSTLANLITFVSFIIIVYYLSKRDFPINERVTVGKIMDFPKFFGTVLFALEAIGVILPLENEMKNPKSFKSSFGVLNVGMFLITFLYVAMGFWGYICYGEDIKASITLNLPEEPLAKVVQILLALSIYMTHSLQCYVAIDIIWNLYIGKRVSDSKKIVGEYIVRTLVVIGTLILAMSLPSLEGFISLVGAFCLSALALAFPAIIESCTFWNVQTKSQNNMMLVKNSIIVVFAICGLLSGTYTAIETIIEDSGKKK